MNLIILKGNITQDLETKTSAQGNMIVKFSMATQRKFAKDGEQQSDFHNCTCFGKTAEFVSKYFQKGSAILVQGELRNDNYTNKEGKKAVWTNVLVNSVEFAGGGKNTNTQPTQQPVQNQGFMNMPQGFAEELPFA